MVGDGNPGIPVRDWRDEHTEVSLPYRGVAGIVHGEGLNLFLQNRANSAESFSSIGGGGTACLAANFQIVHSRSNAIQGRSSLFGKSHPVVIDRNDISVRIDESYPIPDDWDLCHKFPRHCGPGDCGCQIRIPFCGTKGIASACTVMSSGLEHFANSFV